MTIKTNKTLAMLCLIAAMILAGYSSTQTAIFYYSFSNDFLSWFLIFVGLAMDFGKFGFFAYAGFCLHHDKYVKTFVYGLAGLLCIGISFLASLGYDLNKTNEFKNEAVTTSTLYKTNTAIFDSTTKTIEDLRAEVKSLKDNKEKDAEKIKARYAPRIATARKMNFITTARKPDGTAQSVVDLEADRDKEIAGLQTTIDNKEASITQKEKEQKGTVSDLKEAGNNINTTKGVYALAKYFSPNNADAIAGHINLFKNLSIEIASILFAGAFGGFAGNVSTSSPFAMFRRRKKYDEIPDEKPKIDNLPEKQSGELSPNKKNDEISPKKTDEKNKELENTIKALQDNLTELKQQNEAIVSAISQQQPQQRQIGFQMTAKSQQETVRQEIDNPTLPRKNADIIKGIANKKVQAYVDTMYRTAENGVAKGIGTICDTVKANHNIKITENTAKQIYGHLKHSGIIQSVNDGGKKTLILKDRNELSF